MSETLETLQADIAFLKSLADDGRNPSLLGGSILVAAGAVFGLASAGQWAIEAGWIVASPWALSALWLGALAIFLAIMTAIKRRLGAEKASSSANRVAGVAWQTVGWTIFTLAVAMALVCWRAHSALPTLLFPPIVLSLYGLAWTVAAAITRRPWIRMTAGASYLAAIALAAFSVDAAVFLLFAAALLLVAVAPGLALMRQARAAR